MLSSDGGDCRTSENTEIYQLQQNVLTHKKKAGAIMNDILSNQAVKDDVYLRTMLNMYNKEMESISHLADSIDVIYERELKLLLDRESEKKLPTKEMTTIVEEYEKLSGLLDLGIRTEESKPEEKITEETFKNLKVSFIKECPVLNGIFGCLFPDPERTERKTTCAVHALSVLASLRNKHCKNEISLMFTIMLVSYGSGYRMIKFYFRIILRDV